MSRIYYATGTGWQPRRSVLPVTPGPTVRLSSVEAIPGSTVPSTPSSTMFGYNTMDSLGVTKMQWWGKVPIGRCYNTSGSLPLDGSQFAPGGLLYRAAGLGQAGVTSSKRVNMSYIYDPRQAQSDTSPVAQAVKAWVQTVPVGWTVQFVMYHEYNLHTDGPGGRADTPYTNAMFIQSFKVLSQIIEDWGNGRVIPVINPSFYGWADTNAPLASEVAPTTQLHWDLYDNPNGNPTGYKQYGTQYRNAKQLLDPAYAALGRMGYLSGSHGWGIDEFNAPRRVAPRLSTLNTTLGWGPLSPADLDGSGQAQSITSYVNTCLAYPVPPTTILLFLLEAGTNFNQAFTTAGRHDPKSDDFTISASGAEIRGPLYQGFPINVDPTLPRAAWQRFIDISA